ncbi:MAG: O-acetylhomoserine aminocarboxypropyltransferase/cysteine synthase [Clostridia bacterium]|nr:O-acetylhomoserine aminocarboxypropyltransferase/cysteine synthase [Clostridia bacterium]
MDNQKNYQLDTLCVQAGYQPQTGESRIPQICQSTTFYYGSTQAMADCFDLKSDGYFYSRLSNPTLVALEKKMAALEGGAYGIACASGMSATLLTAMTLCETGDNIVVASCIYGGSFNLFGTTLPKLGIECRFFHPDDSAEKIEKLIDEKTKFVFAETVANPPSSFWTSKNWRIYAKSTKCCSL